MNGSNRGYIKSEVLNSWKEIAEYLDRAIRTVQRWERDLKLNVSWVLNLSKGQSTGGP